MIFLSRGAPLAGAPDICILIGLTRYLLAGRARAHRDAWAQARSLLLAAPAPPPDRTARHWWAPAARSSACHAPAARARDAWPVRRCPATRVLACQCRPARHWAHT